MLILGSCVALNLSYPGCCVFDVSPPCHDNNRCYCDKDCHVLNDCDIADIGCHPPPGKTKSDDHTIISHSFIIYNHLF